jgi:hypothetical protein
VIATILEQIARQMIDQAEVHLVFAVAALHRGEIEASRVSLIHAEAYDTAAALIRDQPRTP